MSHAPTKLAGTTTIAATIRMESAAARLGCISFASTHRWRGVKRTANANAHASADYEYGWTRKSTGEISAGASNESSVQKASRSPRRASA